MFLQMRVLTSFVTIVDNRLHLKAFLPFCFCIRSSCVNTYLQVYRICGAL